MKKLYLFIGIFLISMILASSGVSLISAPYMENVGPEINDVNSEKAIPSCESELSNNGKNTTELARRGCCSWHGGVCGCDESSGMIKCCDGTLSPTCTCAGY